MYRLSRSKKSYHADQEGILKQSLVISTNQLLRKDIWTENISAHPLRKKKEKSVLFFLNSSWFRR